MALIYPVPADAPDAVDGTAPDFAELAADLSDAWLVEVAVGEDGDDACFGPLTARAAWDLACGVSGRRDDWVVSVVPLHVPGTVDEVVALFEEDEED
ncbi:hypothetical protein [Blastococcus sp. SYSU D00820]